MSLSLEGKKVWVAGHNGMVGSAIVSRLKKENISTVTVDKKDLNLLNFNDVDNWLKENNPDVIILAAAKVGGIKANNDNPVQFLEDNILIQTNVMKSANANNINRLVFLGSSCIYPKFSEQPIKESSLLTGSLEPTNEWYAVAKISGVKLCQAYRKQFRRKWISIMPTNLYGPGDNYDLESSHVLPALIRKFHEAKIKKDDEVVVWGSGKPMREFMHCDDLASAILFLLMNYDEYEPINVGSGQEISIYDLANLIADVVGYKNKILFDKSKPDGTPRKLMDNTKLTNLGWNNCRILADGIYSTYKDFLKLEM